MFGFFKVAVCSPNVSVGDVDRNTVEIINMIKSCNDKGADICLFPELCTTGYTCQDLFFQNRLIEKSNEAIIRLCQETRRYDMTAVIGAPLKIGVGLYNCAVIMTNGVINGIHVKTFIPNYNEFYEKRWFSSAADLDTDVIMLSDIMANDEIDYEIPLGNDLVFETKENVKFAAEICEDLWTVLPPSTFAALSGAELILNLSASNETIAKRDYRRNLISQQSARCVCTYAYASAGMTESTQDLIFSGHSVVAENGSIIAENNEYIDGGYVLIAETDLEKLRADRIKNKSFFDCGVSYGKSARIIKINCKTNNVRADGKELKLSQTPFVPSDNKHRLQRCMNIFKMQTAALKKRLQVTGAKAVIGVSGGLDSTLALLVTVNAMRELGRSVKDVIAITLPCFGTTDRTHNNAWQLMELLGVDSREINIKNACTVHCEDIGHDKNQLDVTFENVQARERTQVLMDVACKEGGFVVGTGDLSELALGWCTYNADHMSMYGVNCSVPKTLIKWMIASIAEYDVFENCKEVLLDIIDTPISPELLPPDENGNILQETESLVGPYILHDFFLYYVLRFGFSPKKIYLLAKKAFKNDFSSEIILKWLKVFYRRFFTQQFKRSCLPDGVKIGSVCLSPRGDWRMPSDASANIWLSELEGIEG